MEISNVSRMLAYSFVSELVKKNKIKKRHLVSSDADSDQEFEATVVDASNMSFGDLEDYYNNVLSVIENTPEVRDSLVDAINSATEETEELNEYYPTDLVADDETLKRVIFMGDN